ncbi:MAG TPA: response regulator [Myxococcales bacterium]|jgi:signal transduction histidine kinase/ActR/RegA family two-component response regulator
MGVGALVSYGAGRAELKEQAFRQLESVRDIKAAQLGRFFDERRRDVDLLARDPYLLSAFRELDAAFRVDGGAAGGHFSGGDKRNFEAPAAYRAVHDRHFAYLSRFVDRRGYYDLLLLDAGSGEVCFSVEKERDFAAAIPGQPTALREVWLEVLRTRGEVLSDTRPYPPSANAAAQFLAAPIEGPEGTLAGVVALQISLTEVDAIMGERSGMGRSGDTYLVGPDLRPRSDSARDPSRTVQAAFHEPSPARPVNDATARALAGETGSRLTRETDGRAVLAAFAPFEGVGRRWALVAQIDEAEIDSQIDRALNAKVALLLVLSAIAVGVLALLLSLLIHRSIRSVGTQLNRLSDSVLRGELGLRASEEAVSVDYRPVVHGINALVDAFVARLDALPVAVRLLDTSLVVRYANTAAVELARQREAAGGVAVGGGGGGCPAAGLTARCGAQCLVRQAMETGEVVRAELDGGPLAPGRHWLVTASPLRGPGGAVAGGFEVIVDQSEAHRVAGEKRRLEQRVARMQRLEAVGTLAGGIAHDFNNILTYMFAYADIVQGMLPADSPATPQVEQLVAAIERAADLVGQILTFSRQVHGDAKPLELGPLIKEAVKLVRAGLPQTIEVSVDVPDRPLTVLANPAQMHQVAMNLLSNAHQAMGAAGGRLTVSLIEEDLAAEDPRAASVSRPGPHVCLTVQDTGCGMDERTLARIFEPFFTTKPVGQGTGMGLALVHGIVTSCGGAVLVESEVGKGSRFQVLLPRSESAAADAKEAPAAQSDGAGRTVLVVDDERRVCEVTSQLLESLGYCVKTCSSAEEAMEELRQRAADYDAVLTDLRMAGASGLQVATQARERRPELPVVLTTAYTDGVTPEQARAAGVTELLFKPYRRSDLARILAGLAGRAKA